MPGTKGKLQADLVKQKYQQLRWKIERNQLVNFP